MRKLIQFLKPHVAAVCAIFCVLMVQAYCDLSLPGYTSDIVNVGIQQGGIDESIPAYIGEKELQQLLLWIPSKEQQTVTDSYQETTKTFDYDGTVLELKKDVMEDKEAYESLLQTMGKPMLFQTGMQTETEGSTMLPEEITSMLSMPMDEQQRDALLEQIYDQMKDMPESMMEQATPVYVKSIYEILGMDTEKMQNQYILTTGGKMILLAALGMLASIIVGFMSARVGSRVGRDLRGNVFQKVLGFSSSEFDTFSTASLITRSTNDIQQIQMLTIMILRMVLYSPILALGGVWKVFHTNADMSWIIALGVVMILCLVGVLFIVVMPKFKIVQSLVDRLNLVSREILTGIPVIRAFSTEKHEEERFDQANKELTKVNLFVNRAMTFMMPTMMLIMNGITVLIVWNGAHGIDQGNMQVGDMMAFIQYTMQIIMSFLMICMISVMLPRAAVSANRVDEILQSETVIKDPQCPKSLAENGKGEVAFHHVSFRYPGAEEDVLHDLDFVAKPGQTTAIIGSTGSGKSTLVHLIPRFYDVTEGSITIDGEDIRHITQKELREQLGYVPQKGVLFSGTIASNIMYGNGSGSEEEMKEAAEIAQAEAFIMEKRDGYDSSIAQGGTNVSGGQKQRLSIARAIAKHPKIYIFDDSFSALDYKTDVTLRQELKKKTSDSTVIIVAQRISTILHADQILVLDDGVIVGKGTHRELLKTCEAYYQIAASQLSEKELAADMKEVE